MKSPLHLEIILVNENFQKLWKWTLTFYPLNFVSRQFLEYNLKKHENEIYKWKK